MESLRLLQVASQSKRSNGRCSRSLRNVACHVHFRNVSKYPVLFRFSALRVIIGDGQPNRELISSSRSSTSCKQVLWSPRKKGKFLPFPQGKSHPIMGFLESPPAILPAVH